MKTLSESILRKIFPDESLTVGRGGDELNGLSKGSKPKNCKVHLKIPSPFSSDRGRRRDFYAVSVPSMYAEGEFHFVEFRICDAMEGSGYDEFVAICARDIACYSSKKELRELIENSYAFRLQEFRSTAG